MNLDHSTLDPIILDQMFGDQEAPDGSLARENFSAWFGGSQVLDASGAPACVFHGSRVANLDAFSVAKVGSGIVSNNSSQRGYGGAFFFTSSRENAHFYADFDGVSPDDDFIVEAWLAIRRPFVVEDKAMSPTQAIRAAQIANMEHALAGGDNGDYDDIYDGVILRDILDGSHHGDVYIAFAAEQIKSIHNSGLFDLESGELRDTAEGDAVSDICAPPAAARQRVRA